MMNLEIVWMDIQLFPTCILLFRDSLPLGTDLWEATDSSVDLSLPAMARVSGFLHV